MPRDVWSQQTLFSTIKGKKIHPISVYVNLKQVSLYAENKFVVHNVFFFWGGGGLVVIKKLALKQLICYV